MDKIYVVFWTQGGNTQAMAEAIGEGIREAGKEAEVVFVTGADIEALKAAPKFALGCPAMGAEVLEEAEMEPFVCDVEGFASGKKIALFGSYGWGDGEWMRDWTTRMEAAGATVLNGEGLICHETPDEDGLNACRDPSTRIIRTCTPLISRFNTEVPACITFISTVFSPERIVTEELLLTPSFRPAAIRNPVFLSPDVAESFIQSACFVAVHDLFVRTTTRLASSSS